MKWFKAHTSLVNHPKRFRLETLLGSKLVLHHLYCFFSFLAQYKQSGDISDMTPEELARACEFAPTEAVSAEQFRAAMDQAGFIEKKGAGKIVAHDWFKENGYYISENQRHTSRKFPANRPQVSRAIPASTLHNNTVHNNTEKQLPCAEFEAFYKAYPRKINKPKALKAWLARSKEPNWPVLEEMLAKLDRHKQQEQWLKDEGKFIPHPASWLSGRRWEDVLAVPKVRERNAGRADL